MYLILNKERLALGHGEHGWVLLTETEKLRTFQTWLSANQTAMKLQAPTVVSSEELLLRLIGILSFLGEPLHDMLVNHGMIGDAAMVGGVIEHKKHIADLTEAMESLVDENDTLRKEVGKLSLMRGELEAIINNK